MKNIAETILKNAEAEPGQKALAQHAYEVAPHEHALADLLRPLAIPDDVKADLWDAKRQSVNDPKITRLMQIAHLPKEVLDIAESHPNILKYLMETEKPEKGTGGTKSGGAAKDSKSLGHIEIKAAEPDSEAPTAE